MSFDPGVTALVEKTTPAGAGKAGAVLGFGAAGGKRHSLITWHGGDRSGSRLPNYLNLPHESASRDCEIVCWNFNLRSRNGADFNSLACGAHPEED